MSYGEAMGITGHFVIRFALIVMEMKWVAEQENTIGMVISLSGKKHLRN
jgi:hypothetical protein